MQSDKYSCFLKTSIALFVCVLFVHCTNIKRSKENVVKDVMKLYNEESGIKYDVRYRCKAFADKDTSSYSGTIYLERNPEEPLFGGKLWIDLDSVVKYYDSTNIFVIDRIQNRITSYQAHNKQDWAITGNASGDMISTYFLKPSKLNKYLSDTSIKVSMTTNEQYYIIEAHFPDNEALKNGVKRFWIDKETDIIAKIDYSIEFHGNKQFNEWTLSNVEFIDGFEGNVTDQFEEIQASSLIKEYKENKLPELLTFGTRVGEFEGIYIQENKEVGLNDLKGDITILDFWYSACKPCLKAVPHLNQLKKKYGSKGLKIIGINSKDGEGKDRERLPEFIRQHKMKYPVMLVEEEVSEKMNVRVYPSFYVLNKYNEVLYSKYGFGQVVVDSMERVIERELAL